MYLYEAFEDSPYTNIDPEGLQVMQEQRAEGGWLNRNERIQMGFISNYYNYNPPGKNNNWETTDKLARMTVSFIPVAGDIIDTGEAIWGVWDNPGSGWEWISLSICALAWVPLPSLDALKISCHKKKFCYGKNFKGTDIGGGQFPLDPYRKTPPGAKSVNITPEAYAKKYNISGPLGNDPKPTYYADITKDTLPIATHSQPGVVITTGSTIIAEKGSKALDEAVRILKPGYPLAISPMAKGDISAITKKLKDRGLSVVELKDGIIAWWPGKK